VAIYSNNVQGLDQLITAFNKISDEKSNEIIVEASRKSANLILSKAIQKVPVKTGKLRSVLEAKQVKTRSKKYSRTFASTPIFTVGARYATKGNRKGSGVNYSHLVELGHKDKYGGHVPAKPFLRPSADESKEEVLSIIVDAMNKALEEFGK
jgi:HK97 gp10 family phage protein